MGCDSIARTLDRIETDPAGRRRYCVRRVRQRCNRRHQGSVATVQKALLVAGTTQVAVGALSGWPLAAVVGLPGLADTLGVRDVQRLRQAHVDVLMMGGLVTAAALVDDAPPWATRAVRVGAWTNPLLFLPLAFRPAASRSPLYKALTTLSFAITCAGWIGMARAARAG